MKAGAFILCLLWLAAAAYAGYRLTARSFAWVDEPGFGSPAPVVQAQAAAAAPPVKIDVSAFKDKIPPQFQEQAKNLSPQQLLCLRSAVSAAHLQAAMRGSLEYHDLSPQETAAVDACLK